MLGKRQLSKFLPPEFIPAHSCLKTLNGHHFLTVKYINCKYYDLFKVILVTGLIYIVGQTDPKNLCIENTVRPTEGKRSILVLRVSLGKSFFLLLILTKTDRF